MNRSKTIQIFLKDADPDGIKIVELSNSVAKVFVVPRRELDFVKTRSELTQPALYMLFDDERTSVYIGECDNFVHRVKDHEARKDFWQWAIICVSQSGSLNKAVVKYLEYYAVQKAIEINRFSMQNRNAPAENSLHEFDQATALDYFADIELLTAALGYNVFEPRKDESTAEAEPKEKQLVSQDQRLYDTIVSPCSGDGFQRAFVDKNAWWAVRIGQPAQSKLKYVALYESAPVSAIRAYAKITKIEPMPNEPGRYIIYHDGNINYLEQPVVLGENTNLSLQGSRYYLLSDILSSKTIGELTNKAFGTNFVG
jgi:hypothetical protein